MVCAFIGVIIVVGAHCRSDQLDLRDYPNSSTNCCTRLFPRPKKKKQQKKTFPDQLDLYSSNTRSLPDVFSSAWLLGLYSNFLDMSKIFG